MKSVFSLCIIPKLSITIFLTPSSVFQKIRSSIYIPVRQMVVHPPFPRCAEADKINNKVFYCYSAITCGLPARPIICSKSASLYSSQEPDTYCMVDLITTR